MEEIIKRYLRKIYYNLKTLCVMAFYGSIDRGCCRGILVVPFLFA